MSDEPVIQIGPSLDDYDADTIRAERDAAVEVLRVLVALKDGPRDDHYRAAKDDAWDAARKLVGS